MKKTEVKARKKYAIDFEALGLTMAVVFLGGILTGMVTVVCAMKLFIC